MNVRVHENASVLAEAVAARLIVRLADVQAERGSASVVVTGGRIALAIYEAVANSPARLAVDWSRVDVWWGDERFLPSGDPDRNETQVREALLDLLPLDPARVHPMPASDGPDGNDPEAAATRHVGELAASAGPDTGGLPRLDVLMLGVGEDGHVASIFPGHPTEYATGPVGAVHDSPKPPPVRLTLSRETINTADEVWLVAAGPEKAGPVAKALAGAETVPAAGVHGVRRTLWLLDRDAAADAGAHAA